MFEWITGVVSSLGYVGVAALTLIENVFPPIPSELVIPLAGFVAAEGRLRLDLVIALGTAGSLTGATLWYAISRKVGERRLREWIERHGWWLTLSPRDVDRAQQWLLRHGKAAVLLCRLVPGVRTFVSLPAGFAAMPFLPFLLYSAAGTTAWTAALAYAGALLQENFTLVSAYVDIAANVTLAVVGALLVWRYVKCWPRVPRRATT